MKTKGASGPLTLRCSRCGARNVGAEKPIKSEKLHRTNPGRSKYASRCEETAVKCSECGWAFWSNHPSVQVKP